MRLSLDRVEYHNDHMQTFSQDLPMRVLEHLKLLDGDFGGFPVHRLEHSLQTATRAHRDGRDEEYVVCCLMTNKLEQIIIDVSTFG